MSEFPQCFISPSRLLPAVNVKTRNNLIYEVAEQQTDSLQLALLTGPLWATGNMSEAASVEPDSPALVTAETGAAGLVGRG